jgi:hypothetical protein
MVASQRAVSLLGEPPEIDAETKSSTSTAMASAAR